MSKRKPYIFMTQDKLIDLCRYDIGWIETVGGKDLDAYPENGLMFSVRPNIRCSCRI